MVLVIESKESENRAEDRVGCVESGVERDFAKYKGTNGPRNVTGESHLIPG